MNEYFQYFFRAKNFGSNSEIIRLNFRAIVKYYWNKMCDLFLNQQKMIFFLYYFSILNDLSLKIAKCIKMKLIIFRNIININYIKNII